MDDSDILSKIRNDGKQKHTGFWADIVSKKEDPGNKYLELTIGGSDPIYGIIEENTDLWNLYLKLMEDNNL
mgnify:CR=1 FL=1